MNEPVRLLDGSGSEKTRAILRAGLADAPRPDALPRVATALGVSAGALAVAMPATALMNGATVAGAVTATIESFYRAQQSEAGKMRASRG